MVFALDVLPTALLLLMSILRPLKLLLLVETPCRVFVLVPLLDLLLLSTVLQLLMSILRRLPLHPPRLPAEGQAGRCQGMLLLLPMLLALVRRDGKVIRVFIDATDGVKAVSAP